MKSPGGSRIIALAKVSVALALTASTLAVATERLSPSTSATPGPQLGDSLGHFDLLPVTPSEVGDRPTRLAGRVGNGCTIFIAAQMCVATVDAIKELGGVSRMEVLGTLLPVHWIAPEGSEPIIAVLTQYAPRNAFVVSRRIWDGTLAPDFTPQFFLIDAQGILVARGWPDPAFLRSLPHELQRDFDQRCLEGAAAAPKRSRANNPQSAANDEDV